MKKLFALLLTTTLLFCAIPFVASADDSAVTFVDIDSIDDFYAVMGDGTTEKPYALVNMLDGKTNYRLTADITFGSSPVALPKVVLNSTSQTYEYVYTDSTNTTKQTCEWDFTTIDQGMIGNYEGIFDGNGHSIVYTGTYVATASGAFFVDGKLRGDIKNLTVGSKDTPVQFTCTKNGRRDMAILALYCEVNKVVIENVVVYGDITVNGTGARNIGLFLYTGKSGVTFNNCRAYGSITLANANASVHRLGGFVGAHLCNAGDGAPIIFNNCYSDVDIALDNAKATSAAGGLLGCLCCTNDDTPLYATNCVTVGDLPDHENVEIGTGRLLGNVQNNKAEADTLVNIVDCQKPVFNAVGASVKIDDATLRFRVGVAVYNAYVDMYGATNVKTGVIYAEKSVADGLVAQSNFKIDATGVTKVEATMLDNGNIYADVAATANSYGTEYTALGYIQYTTDGTTWTTEYAEASTTRSVSYVATAALADVKDVQGNGYGYATADGKYCFYTAEQQTKLASYIVASAS